jgi:hypothetical protein
MVVEPVERRFREGEGRGGGAGAFKAHLWREGKRHGRGEWRRGGSARPAMPRAGEGEGRGRREVREEADGWAPSVGERERGREEAGLGRVGRKGRRAARGKRKKGGGRREVCCGPKGERKGGSVCFFQILLNNFSKPF